MFILKQLNAAVCEGLAGETSQAYRPIASVLKEHNFDKLGLVQGAWWRASYIGRRMGGDSMMVHECVVVNYVHTYYNSNNRIT